MGEGESESWYIQMMKRNENMDYISLKPELPQKKKLSDLFAKVEELAEDYDKVFWIVDLDVILKESKETKNGKISPLAKFKGFHQKISKKHGDKVTIIINNPCFEYWFLLHFIKTSKYYKAYEELLRELKKHLSNYEKSRNFYTKKDNDIYLILRPHLEQAINNAKTLGRFDFDNPHTGISEMHLFFEDDEISRLIFGDSEAQKNIQESGSDSSNDKIREFENIMELLKKIAEFYDENTETLNLNEEESLKHRLDIIEEIDKIQKLLKQHKEE